MSTILCGFITLLTFSTCVSRDPCNRYCNHHGSCKTHTSIFGSFCLACTCNHGYTGACCETNINECHSNPCHHLGTCHDGINKYTCSCRTGYTGNQCEININDCANHPCLHGGSCHDGVHSYTCSCPPGYMGSRCETDTNECHSNPCQNSGICHDGLNKYTCLCRPGYTGVHCEQDINECASHPCLHGGFCHHAVHRYTCSCRPGYTGVNCEININECASNPCQHSGVCHDTLNGYTCSCRPGYTGTHCEINIDECASNPCHYDAVCHDGVNGYSCSCSSGFTGADCRTELNECLSNPCRNGGTCVNQFNGYKCICMEGDTGTNCEIGSYITDAPTVTLERERIVQKGAAVVKIPCYAEGIPIPDIVWESIDSTLPRNAKQIAHYLVFENVTMEDAGYYTCTARNRVGNDVKAVHLIVDGNPSRTPTAPIITAPSTVTVKYYTDATLVCNVTGFPKPSVVWEFLHENINYYGETLVVNRVTNETIGVYTCIATNDIGSSQANIMLQAVQDPSKIVTIPHAFVGDAGQSHNFTCRATGHPPPTITWTFSSFSQQSFGLPSHLEFDNEAVLELTNMQESGVLTCTASNEFGKDTASAHVIVKHTTSIFG